MGLVDEAFEAAMGAARDYRAAKTNAQELVALAEVEWALHRLILFARHEGVITPRYRPLSHEAVAAMEAG